MLFPKSHVLQALPLIPQRVHAMLVMLAMVSFVVHVQPIRGVLEVYPMDALNMLPLQYSHLARISASAMLATLGMVHLRAPPPAHFALLALTVQVAMLILVWLVHLTPFHLQVPLRCSSATARQVMWARMARIVLCALLMTIVRVVSCLHAL